MKERGNRRVVELRHDVAGLLDRANRDPVRLNVIGMSVAAEVVVGHHDLRADFADDLDELRRGNLEVGLPEAARILVGRRVHHPGVAVTACAAEKSMIANAQCLARLFEFVDAPAPELVGLVGRDPREGSGTRTSPSSPSVQVTRVTLTPSAAYLAIVAPVPIVSSSGWACTSNKLRSVMRNPKAAPTGRISNGQRPPSRDGRIRPVTDDSFLRLQARTARFTLGRPRGFTVSPDGARVLFLRSRGGTDRVTCLWSYEVATGAEVLLADPVELLAAGLDSLPDAERARRERAREQAAGIVAYSTDAAVTRAAFALSGRLFVADVSTGRPTELAADGLVFDPHLDPTGRTVAYATRGTLRVVNVDERRLRP